MKECKVRFPICEKSWRRYVANGTGMRSIFFSLSDRYSIYIVFRFQKLISGQLFAAVCVPFWFFHILGVTSKHLCSLKKRKCIFKMANSDKHFMFRASKTTQISNQIHDNQKLANTGTITLIQQSQGPLLLNKQKSLQQLQDNKQQLSFLYIRKNMKTL